MRFAYADPPYIGQAKRHYSHDPNCAEVDHSELVERLVRGFPDGWALSASSSSLDIIIPILNALCPPGWRIGIWCKNFCAFQAQCQAVLCVGAGNLLWGQVAEMVTAHMPHMIPVLERIDADAILAARREGQ